MGAKIRAVEELEKEMAVLHVQPRNAEAKPKALRKAGVIPMALVQKGGETTLVQANVRDVHRALGGAHGAGMVDVAVEGSKSPKSVIIKSIDRDVLSRSIINVTFQEVSKDDLIRVDLPIIAVGTPEAVAAEEAILVNQTDHIKVRGKVSDIPDNFEVDVSGLGIHESITAGQLNLPPGLELMSTPDAQLFAVTIAKEPVLEEEAPAEAGEVPVVGEEAAAEASEE